MPRGRWGSLRPGRREGIAGNFLQCQSSGYATQVEAQVLSPLKSRGSADRGAAPRDRIRLSRDSSAIGLRHGSPNARLASALDSRTSYSAAVCLPSPGWPRLDDVGWSAVWRTVSSARSISHAVNSAEALRPVESCSTTHDHLLSRNDAELAPFKR